MSEKRIFQILEMCLWVINPLIVVMAIFAQQIQPGLFLQWIGKFHPLVLHFPIVFGMLVAIYFLFFQHRRLPVDTEKMLLAINSLFASGVVICGLLLSKQTTYDNELISWHKWGGIAIALLSWLLIYILDQKISLKKYLSFIFLVVLTGSAHKGAQLTHGVNALSFPQATAAENGRNSTDGKTTLYETAIAPLLAQKCISCHGADKAKGGLRLNTPENILKGGKHGDLLKGDQPNGALFLARIHLPQSDEKHMPPDGKMQLTPEELTILSKWIKGGSNFKIKVNELPKEDTLFILTSKMQSVPDQKFQPKNNLPDLKEFNSNYCAANYLFSGTDEVEVNFFQGTFYDTDNLKNLTKIKNQIVRLNMQGMPLTNEDLKIITQFSNLQQINLNYTKLDIASLGALKSMPNLKSVSICGVEFDEVSLNKFLDQAKYNSVNLWSKNFNKKVVEKMVLKYPAVKIIAGDNMDDVLIKISSPIVEQDSSIISNHLDIKLKHVLKGTVLRYTTDGTDPDSLKSSEYTGMLRFSQNTTLKVKAFRPGWISSDIVQRTYYKSEIHPDTIFFVKNPDPKYAAHGAITLIDYELGDKNSSNGRWLGYKDSNMEFIIGFNQAKPLTEAHFNTLVDIGAHILPVVSISVQGSNDGNQFERITEVKFPAIKKPGPPRGVNTFSCVFPKSTSYKYYRFVVANVKKLPLWHSGKGKPAWIFVDELFLN